MAQVEQDIFVHFVFSQLSGPIKCGKRGQMLEQVKYKYYPQEHRSHHEVAEPVLNSDFLGAIIEPVRLVPVYDDVLGKGIWLDKQYTHLKYMRIRKVEIAERLLN